MVNNLQSNQNDSQISWKADISDSEQPKAPIMIGLATGIGALLWLGPFNGMNNLLNPAKLANIMGGAGGQVNNFLALLGTLGAVTSTITTIIIGALSDLTRSRWGRRTPWLIVGSILTAIVMVGLGLINSKSGLPFFIVLWCLLQKFINMIDEPLIAVIADRVAPMHRGLISSIYATGFVIGQYGGPVVGGTFLKTNNPGLVNVGYFVFAFLMLLSGPIAALMLKEKSSLKMPRMKMNWKRFMQYFIFPVHNTRNFYLALFGKMLINITTTTFATYQLFILTTDMGLRSSSAGKYISLMGTITMIAAILFSTISGPISDKMKTRKWPVAFAAFLIATGTLLPYLLHHPVVMLVYGVFAGIGSGIFFSVDQALNLEVLPNPANSAKDLGILNLANTGGQILGPVIGAILYGIVGHNYLPILPILTVIALVGAALVLSIKEAK